MFCLRCLTTKLPLRALLIDDSDTLRSTVKKNLVAWGVAKLKRLPDAKTGLDLFSKFCTKRKNLSMYLLAGQ